MLYSRNTKARYSFDPSKHRSKIKKLSIISNLSPVAYYSRLGTASENIKNQFVTIVKVGCDCAGNKIDGCKIIA